MKAERTRNSLIHQISVFEMCFFKYILKKSQINDFQVAFAEVTSEGGCNVMGRIDLKQILRS